MVQMRSQRATGDVNLSRLGLVVREKIEFSILRDRPRKKISTSSIDFNAILPYIYNIRVHPLEPESVIGSMNSSTLSVIGVEPEPSWPLPAF